MKKVPSVVQLPGGIKLQGIPFKIVDYNDDGSPATFKVLNKDEKGDCVLFADEGWIRSPLKK